MLGLQVCEPPHLAFIWVLETITQVLRLVWEALYRRNHLPKTVPILPLVLFVHVPRNIFMCRLPTSLSQNSQHAPPIPSCLPSMALHLHVVKMALWINHGCCLENLLTRVISPAASPGLLAQSSSAKFFVFIFGAESCYIGLPGPELSRYAWPQNCSNPPASASLEQDYRHAPPCSVPQPNYFLGL